MIEAGIMAACVVACVAWCWWYRRRAVAAISASMTLSAEATGLVLGIRESPPLDLVSSDRLAAELAMRGDVGIVAIYRQSTGARIDPVTIGLRVSDEATRDTLRAFANELPQLREILAREYDARNYDGCQ